MLSTEYATALYELTIDKIDKIKGEFDDFMKIISANSDFRKFLSSPAIKKEKKTEQEEKPENEKISHLISLVREYEPKEHMDEQMKNLYMKGLTDKNL